jgi:hypothetical protein
MSDGIRSGVNCTRLASRPSTVPSVSTSLVLASPGTPTRRPCPLARMVMSDRSTTFSWPKITAWMASRARPIDSSVASAFLTMPSSSAVGV